MDEFGVEYWHGEPIESKEATKEEQKEMEKMLESFKDDSPNFNELVIKFIKSKVNSD